LETRDEQFIKEFKQNRAGIHIVNDGNFVVLDDSTDAYKYADAWIYLSPMYIFGAAGRRKCLLKSSIPSKSNPEQYSKTEAEILTANNFILPEIAKQFGLDSAEYARFEFRKSPELESSENIAYITSKGPVYKIEPKKEYVLTPSFLSKDEELIPFGNILDNDEIEEKRLSVIWKKVESFLINRGIKKTNISKIREDYAVKSLFGAFCELNDNHNYNDGIIISNNPTNRTARIAPAFDLDFAMRVYNHPNYNLVTFVKTADNGSIEVGDILNQFKDSIPSSRVSSIINNFDPNKAISKAEKNHKIKLSSEAHFKYLNLFDEQHKKLVNSYNKLYSKNYDYEKDIR